MANARAAVVTTVNNASLGTMSSSYVKGDRHDRLCLWSCGAPLFFKLHGDRSAHFTTSEIALDAAVKIRILVQYGLASSLPLLDPDVIRCHALLSIGLLATEGQFFLLAAQPPSLFF